MTSKTPTDRVPVFVYGTLMQDLPLHRLLGGRKYVWKGRVEGTKLYDLGPFPGMKRDDDAKSFTEGEVYLVDEETLANLDRAEGVPSLYTREQVDVVVDPVDDQRSHVRGVYAYFYQGATSEGMSLPTGSWRSRLS